MIFGGISTQQEHIRTLTIRFQCVFIIIHPAVYISLIHTHDSQIDRGHSLGTAGLSRDEGIHGTLIIAGSKGLDSSSEMTFELRTVNLSAGVQKQNKQDYICRDSSQSSFMIYQPRIAAMTSAGFSDLNTALPATRISAPNFTSFPAFAADTPPST